MVSLLWYVAVDLAYYSRRFYLLLAISCQAMIQDKCLFVVSTVVP